MSGSAGVVQFVFATWIARYKEFAALDPNLAQLYFNEATLYCDNTGGGPVTDVPTLTLLLYMLTAHIAALNALDANNNPQSTLVGRISDATEGSVHVSTQMEQQPGSAAWYNQTKYGAAYWRATARYRMFNYVSGPQPFAQSGWPFPWR